MKRHILVWGVLCFFVPVSISAQEVDPKKAYEEFRKKAVTDYNDFRRQVNKKYAEFMSKCWADYKMLPAIPSPKNKELPPVVKKDSGTVPQNRPVPYDTIVKPAPIPEQPQPVVPIPEVVQPTYHYKKFLFYARDCKVRFPIDSKYLQMDVTKEDVGTIWDELSSEQYNNLMCDCLAARKEMNLCDWAYLQFLELVGLNCVGVGNRAVFLTNFLYCQSGYKTRLGLTGDNKLVILVASRHKIMDRVYYKINGEMFYPLSAEGDLSICNCEFTSEKPLSFIVGQEQYFGRDVSARRTLCSERYPEMRVEVETNKDLVDFYSSYPKSSINDDFTTLWQFYARTPLSRTAKDALYPALKRFISGKSELTAVNMILNFVQTAFVYEYDEKVWGYDRPFFAEETLYYPYCDCEDRSILFSNIVRDLLHLDVVLLFYPGHLATAVKFTSTVMGDYLNLSDGRYVICDPTYIGASVGETMPDHDNTTAKVILLK